MKTSPLSALLLSLAALFSGGCDDSSGSGSASESGVSPTASGTGSDSLTWNPSIAYGSLTDSRDGQVYKTVRIGTQTWMAENLNYSGVGVCYNNSTDSCKKYGRLYTWTEVMNGSGSSKASPSGVQGICPSGWHVPSDSEWTTLKKFVEADSRVGVGKGGTSLKSTGSWDTSSGSSGNGTDLFGFRALAGGISRGTSFYDLGNYGDWWSATEYDASYAWHCYMYDFDTILRRAYYSKTNARSLRCTKD